MERTRILEEVQKIVAKALGVEKDRITDSATFENDLGADSIDAVEILMAIEQKFVVTVPDNVAFNRDIKVGDIVDWLKLHI